MVEADRYVLALTRYIHRNPLDGPPRVTPLATYPWSSYPAYLNQAACPQWLNREVTYDLLGHRRKYLEYQRYVEGEAEDSLADFYGQPFLQPVLGSQKFLSALVAKGKVAPKRQAKAQRMLPSLAVITQAVSIELDVPVKQLRQAVRGRGKKMRPDGWRSASVGTWVVIR